ncbi:MAG TPA: ComEC/Rec2 family competence protein [Beutenbergiaceae bacterium]|nr:ComEC/Rec2 family competence protein [Beutenbergiaceae bacterium]
MIGPVDIRLAPAALGAWIVCFIGVTTPYLPVVLAAVTIVGIGGLVWPRGRPRHRVQWRGWVSYTLLAASCVSVVAGTITTLHIQHRKSLTDVVVDSAEQGSPLLIRLTSDAREGARGFGTHGVVLDDQSRLGAGWLALPVYVMNAQPDWRAGETVLLHAHAYEVDDHRVIVSATAVVHHDQPQGIYALVGILRDGVRESSKHLAPQARGLVPGVSIGDDRRLPAHIDEAMRTTSLTHLTAVSGAHVGVVVGTTMVVLGRTPRSVRVAGSLTVLLLMVIVVLPTPSVVRAAGMGAMTLVAMLRRRPRVALSALFATVIGLLLHDPWLATSIGFGLSVAATTGILTTSRVIGSLLGQGALARAGGVALAAQLWCAPLLLTFDSSLATYSVPANILAVPALAPSTVLSLASAVAFPLMPTVSVWLAKIAGLFTGWIATCATVFADLPGAALPWLEGPVGVINLVGWLVVGIWFAVWLNRKRTWQA